MENIKLNNGLYLNRVYGKYQPNLTIITSEPVEQYDTLPEDKELSEYFRKFSEGGVKVRRGEYRKNEKGTDIFDFTRTGHLLVEIYWYGRRTNPNLDLPNLEPLYHRIASSNGGGTGITYYIFPENTQFDNIFTENDF